MARLIDADELKKEVESAFHGALGITVTGAVHEIIDRTPTIDIESLHRERTVATNADCIRPMSDERLADQLVIDINVLASWMIGESKKKSTIADASENELNEQNPKYPCIKGGRLYLACVCDGTLYFQGELRKYIQAFGCTDIQGRTEIVKDADPPWMNCRFVVHGKVPGDWPKEADRVWFDQKKGLIHILPKETMED